MPRAGELTKVIKQLHAPHRGKRKIEIESKEHAKKVIDEFIKELNKIAKGVHKESQVLAIICSVADKSHSVPDKLKKVAKTGMERLPNGKKKEIKVLETDFQFFSQFIKMPDRDKRLKAKK